GADARADEEVVLLVAFEIAEGGEVRAEVAFVGSGEEGAEGAAVLAGVELDDALGLGPGAVGLHVGRSDREVGKAVGVLVSERVESETEAGDGQGTVEGAEEGAVAAAEEEGLAAVVRAVGRRADEDVGGLVAVQVADEGDARGEGAGVARVPGLGLGYQNERDQS